MKKLWPILILFLIFSCKEQKEGEKEVAEPDLIVFNGVYMDFREMVEFEGYNKVSDTVIFTSQNNLDPSFRLTHKEKEGENLILFSGITLNEKRDENKRILDRLKIANLGEDEVVTIGYCSLNGEHSQEIVAIVKRTQQEYIEEVVRAWRANPETKDFEKISNPGEINCINEFRKVDDQVN